MEVKNGDKRPSHAMFKSPKGQTAHCPSDTLGLEIKSSWARSMNDTKGSMTPDLIC